MHSTFVQLYQKFSDYKPLHLHLFTYTGKLAGYQGSAPASVWDIDSAKVHTVESVEEIQRRELEEKEESKHIEDEICRQQLEANRVKQEERETQEREERERQEALERQRREELGRKRF